MRGGKAWKKWVSLSTLSVAGAAVGAHSLADVIVVPVNQNFNYNSNTPFTLDLPGINSMQVFSTPLPPPPPGSPPFSRSVALGGVAGATYFQVRRYAAGTWSGGTRKILQGGARGATWSNIGGTIGNVGILAATDTTFGPIGPSSYSHRLFAFRFKDTSPQGQGKVKYGWLEASSSGPSSPSNVPVTVEQYAYDNSGFPLPLGSTISAIPEPSTTALAGLGALVLGAAGVRRWRKARQAAGG
jgi:hypothetical protein